MRVACSGGKYPLEAVDNEDEDDFEKEDEDDFEKEDAKKRKKATVVYSDFAFTSKFKTLLKELENKRDKDPTCKSHVSSHFVSAVIVPSIRTGYFLLRFIFNVTAKSLVFSQYTSTLKWLQEELPKHGFQFRTLSGDMSMTKRAKALHDFQSDPPTTIFLLSMRYVLVLHVGPLLFL
jgi:SNF2 family DNA or RNA helicase